MEWFFHSISQSVFIYSLSVYKLLNGADANDIDDDIEDDIDDDIGDDNDDDDDEEEEENSLKNLISGSVYLCR